VITLNLEKTKRVLLAREYIDQQGKKNKGEIAFEMIIKNRTKNERKNDHLQEI
jgi:hypothetical protein